MKLVPIAERPVTPSQCKCFMMYTYTYTRTLRHTHTHEVVAGGGEVVRRSSGGGCACLATGAARGVESAVWVGVLSGDVGVGVDVGVCAWLFCWAAAIEV